MAQSSLEPYHSATPASKRAMIGLPQTGDRPGSAEVDSTLPRMAAEIDGVEVSQANHTGDRGIALCPLFFVDISVYASETLISGNVTALKEKYS